MKEFNKGKGFFGRLSRRGFFRGTGLAALAGLTGSRAEAAKKKSPLTTYESIGVKPIINCRDVTTTFGGSLELPEVVKAMEKASKNFVIMEELIDAVGRQLAELTGAEWGGVTSGCAACLTAGTLACVCGSDPQKMALPPDLMNLKNECIVPRNHRTGYDRAILSVGVKMIEIDTLAEMENAINDRTAMIFVLGRSLDGERGPSLALEDMVRIGKKHGIPVLVDAAAERFDCPNPYIKAGVDLVAYSGGKHLYGPQCTGILLGRKDLVYAAVQNMAPYMRFGRPMKVGKEEYMGVLAAAQQWVKRDHDSEWKEWERMLKYIAKKLEGIPTVTTKIVKPQGRSNYYPNLIINWDQNVIKITPNEVGKKLLGGEPRIACAGNRVIPITMQSGEEKHVARRFNEILSAAR